MLGTGPPGLCIREVVGLVGKQALLRYANNEGGRGGRHTKGEETGEAGEVERPGCDNVFIVHDCTIVW